MGSEENGNALISGSSALMTLFTSSSFVFDWVISVLPLSQTSSPGKTSRDVLYAFINLIGPLQLAIHAEQKKNRNASEQESHWEKTNKETIFNDGSLLFVLSQCVSYSPE